MKKTLTLIAFTLFVAAPSFATYIVVLKNGSKYAAKEKWTVVNGKAIVKLENGQSLQLDPALIDVAKSEEMTKVGMANANILDLNADLTKGQPPKQPKPSLGESIKLRPRGGQAPAPAPAPTQSTNTPAPISGVGELPNQVVDKFDRAYDNIGIFEKKVISTGDNSLRAEMTVDTEERVFNAISATSFLMVKNAGVAGVQIDMVELFMRTTTGGAAGRFQMSRADAEALDQRRISQQEYFIRKVIY
jgi:hypothetical protein